VAEFTTLRLRLIKVAARVIESASRIRVAFASACPDATTFKAVALALKSAPT
ncbi:MAG: transposase, partial [Sphingomonadales bacterium]|nr:transposase [Sphingomonadales bacterium]